MNIYYIVGIIGFLVFIVSSRLINEKALTTLTLDEKAKLILLFSSSKKNLLLPIMFLIGAFLIMIRSKPVFYFYSFITYISAIIIFMIFMTVSSFIKLKKINLPKIYFRYYSLSIVLQYIALIMLFGSVVINLLKK